MFSVRNPGKVYPVSEDIVETDMDTDVDEYNYDGKLVYRGNLDTAHSTPDVQVYWLYDDNSKRVGLAEHSNGEHTALWFRDNEFSTLLQEDWTPHNKTLWSLMSQFAYEDCMKHGWTTVKQIGERTKLTIVTPDDLVAGVTPIKLCTRCILSNHAGCLIQEKEYKNDPYQTLFVDEDGVIFVPPSDSKLFNKEDGFIEKTVDVYGAGE